MKSSTSQPVNSAPTWGSSTKNASVRPSDPMAFFDLIMESARTMSSKTGQSFDPVASTTASASQSQETAGAMTSQSNSDDRRDESAPIRDESIYPVDTAHHEPEHETEDVAAVAEFSEERNEQDEGPQEPDAAALETAGAAGQQEKLLGAPDPLAAPEQSGDGDAEASSLEAPQLKASQLAAGPEKSPTEDSADQPLDTTKIAEDAPAEGQVENPEVVNDGKAAMKETSSSGPEAVEAEQAVVEAEDAPQGAEELREPKSDRESQREENDADRRAAEADSIRDDAKTGDSNERGGSDQDNREGRADRADRKKAANGKAEVNEANRTTAISSATEPGDHTQNAAKNMAPPPAAPAAGATSVQSTSGSSSSSSNVAGITSLLQRGLQRGTLQKSTEGRPAGQLQLDPKQQVRLINRVARAVESTPPGQPIRIRLNPAELGALKVEIKLESGNMTARIETENPATRQVLLENLPQLRERLAETGINVQQFEVDLMGQESTADRGTSHFGEETAGEGDRGSGRRNLSGRGHEDEPETTPQPQINKEAERESRNLNITI